MSDELNEARARLLSAILGRIRFAFPIRRRMIDPNAFETMFNPLRTRRDYTSLGRPTFLVTGLPEALRDEDED